MTFPNRLQSFVLRLIACISSISLMGAGALLGSAHCAEPVYAVVKTSLGDIKLELDPNRAPLTVENFVNYAKSGHYDGTVFHRVIEKFMIQGGGLDKNLQEKKTQAPIKNEAKTSGLRNVKYSVAMARKGNPDSATAQFFISTVDNSEKKPSYPLDFDVCPDRFGYCVFGKVIEGESVVNEIAKVKTTIAKGMEDVPVTPVVIESVRIVDK